MVPVRITNANQIDFQALAKIVAEGRGVCVQFDCAESYSAPALSDLNRACERFGSLLEVRFYGHGRHGFDCRNLSFLPAARSLYLDCLETVTHLEQLKSLGSLEELSFDVFEMPASPLLTFENLHTLRRLVLGQNRKRDLDLAPLANFRTLTSLGVVGHTRGIEAIGRLPILRQLSLWQIAKSTRLAFVSDTAGLAVLSIGLGGRRDIAEIHSQAAEEIEVTRVRGFAEFEPGRFPSLQRLRIEDQLQMEKLSLARAPNLRSLAVRNCKNFHELQGIEHLDSLETLSLAGTALDPDFVMRLRFPPSLKTLTLCGYGERKDKVNGQQLAARGLRH